MADQTISLGETAMIAGRSWHVSHRFDAVANDATINVLINVEIGAKPFVVGDIETEGKAYVEIYEGVTTSSDGTGLTSFNRNRNEVFTDGVVVSHTPTITDSGTLIDTSMIAGGATPGHRTIGGGSEVGADWVFKSDTKYVIAITNKSGSAIDISVHLDTWQR